jgi:anti-anti-sigma factor
MTISTVECRVEHSFPVALVSLIGVLDLGTADEIRGQLLTCLVEQPTALVVDLAGLEVKEDLALTVFAVVRRRAADWPGTQMILCGAGPNLVRALRRSSLTRLLPVVGTRAEALAGACDVGSPRCLREVYPPLPTAPQRARAMVAQAAQAWGLPPSLTPTLQVIASELTANAVVHAGTPLEFAMTLRNGLVHLSVRDGNPAPVRLPEWIGEDAERGRGLLVVAALATAWGSVAAGDGKVVWATVRPPPAAGRRGAAGRPPGRRPATSGG